VQVKTIYQLTGWPVYQLIQKVQDKKTVFGCWFSV